MARVSAGSRRTTTEDSTVKTSICSLLAIACIAMASAAVSAFERVRSTVAFALVWLHDINQIALKQPKPKCRPAPLVQAKAFVTRLVKRDRPTIMSRWRMCPST